MDIKMNNKNKNSQGQCYCGTVKFKIELPVDFCAHCHCESCRRSHAVPFVTWTSVPLKQFSYISGEDNLSWYRSSEWIVWGFCKTCGSSMLYQAEKSGHPESPKTDRIYIAVGCLSEPIDKEPGAHVSYEEKVPWTHFSDTLPKYRGNGEEEISS